METIVETIQVDNDRIIIFKHKHTTCEVGSDIYWTEATQFNFTENKVEHTILQVTNGRGVAGGALFMKANVFKEIGGYDESRGLYGGNESSLYDRFGNKRCGICVAPDLLVYHPPEEDKGYQQWKNECQNSIRATGTCGKDKGYYG